jgi:hypothetical protein
LMVAYQSAALTLEDCTDWLSRNIGNRLRTTPRNIHGLSLWTFKTYRKR